MASPQLQEFVVYDPTTGAPKTGVAIGPGATQIHFTSYTNDAGAPLAQPTISEIGGGKYSFLPVFTIDHTIDYVVSTGGNSPLYYSNFIRPEDYNIDTLTPVGAGGIIFNMLRKILDLFGIS